MRDLIKTAGRNKTTNRRTTAGQSVHSPESIRKAVAVSLRRSYASGTAHARRRVAEIVPDGGQAAASLS